MEKVMTVKEIRTVPYSIKNNSLMSGDKIKISEALQYGEGIIVGFSEKTGNPLVYFYSEQKLMGVFSEDIIRIP